MNAEESDASPFGSLKNLETLVLRMWLEPGDAGDPTEPYLFPTGLLAGISSLKEVSIETRVAPSGHEVQLHEEIFKGNPKLERVEIKYPKTFIERHTFDHLHGLKELLLLNSSSWTPVKFPELVLSGESPLYRAIRSGETTPSRYRVAEGAND